MNGPFYSDIVFLAYAGVLGILCIYGLHRYQLVYLYYKHSRNVPHVTTRFDLLPTVTVQLPMYNERYVARRVIEHACLIDYPRDRLEIQVLDDSTDDTRRIAVETVQRMRDLGHNVVYLHRDNRAGYKAGALQAGLASASGRFVLIFDADFVPDPTILLQTVHYFTDPKVGMVQTRWEHLNRNDSIMTQAQAVLLDGHFVMEHGARNRAGRFMSFNGTAGIWRRTTIEDAGGWQHDTLTEDLDLSYRAQLKGWKFLFVPQVSCPAELPPEMPAFKAQQRRWSQGGAQTCRKLLTRVLRSALPTTTKLEAFFHLTGCLVYVLMVLLVLLLMPMLLAKVDQPEVSLWWELVIDASLLMVATCSAGCFYVCSQRELGFSWWDSIRHLPSIISVGVGLSLNNALATLQGLCSTHSEFVRTPKYGVDGSNDYRRRKGLNRYRHGKRHRIQAYVELGLGTYVAACFLISLWFGWLTFSLPLLALFAWGFFYVGCGTLISFHDKGAWRKDRPADSIEVVGQAHPA